MKHIFLKAAAVLMMMYGLSSCKKSAIIDGGVSNPRVNMTTYDYLKSNSWHLFDTTLILIDKAGMKDIINGDVTFFAPTNYSINKYIATRRDAARKISEKLDYTLDSLLKEFTPQMLRDSMSRYCFKGKVTRDQMTEVGKSFESLTPGAPLNLYLTKYTFTKDGLMTTIAYLVSARRVIGDPDVWVDGKLEDPNDDDDADIASVCQTSGVLTTNGVVHVMANSHIWNFYTN